MLRKLDSHFGKKVEHILTSQVKVKYLSYEFKIALFLLKNKMYVNIWLGAWEKIFSKFTTKAELYLKLKLIEWHI